MKIQNKLKRLAARQAAFDEMAANKSKNGHQFRRPGSLKK